MARKAITTGASLSLKVRKFVTGKQFIRGTIAIFGFFALWQVGSMGLFPFMHAIPTPITVGETFWKFLITAKYWQSSMDSTLRVMYGFVAAQLVGIPLGLSMGWNRNFKDFTYPLFELMRPIPPPGLGAGFHSLLAHQRDLHRLHHLYRGLFHHRAQRAGRSQRHP